MIFIMGRDAEIMPSGAAGRQTSIKKYIASMWKIKIIALSFLFILLYLRSFKVHDSILVTVHSMIGRKLGRALLT